MLKKPITYTDFLGETHTEDFYFNLSAPEIVEMEVDGTGSLSDNLKDIIASGDGARIMRTFKDIIRRSYGVRSEDGRRFIKEPEAFAEFEQTGAYAQLFMELVTDAGAAVEFVTGILPSDLVEKMNKADEEAQNNAPKRPQDMSRDELLEAFAEKNALLGAQVQK